MSLDSDLVVVDGVVIGGRLTGRRADGVVVVAHLRTVRTDLVSAHHIMW